MRLLVYMKLHNTQVDNIEVSYTEKGECITHSVVETICNIVIEYRNRSADSIRSILPSPHSELILGTVLGINDIKMNPTFNDVLVSTGTIHVVVVSGYNISLINSLIMSLIGSKRMLRDLSISIAGTFIYALITGFGIPAVRAWIMGSIVSISRYSTRKINGLFLLLISAYVMVMISPKIIEDISFHLSFLATLSLMLFSPPIEEFILVLKSKNLKHADKSVKTNGITGDLITTLAAQVLVWPYISYKFGRVSLISPLVNALILWTIPLVTIFGGILLVISYLSQLTAYILSWPVYIPADIFIRTIYFFGRFAYSSVSFEMNIAGLVLYYILIFMILVHYKRRSKHKLGERT